MPSTHKRFRNTTRVDSRFLREVIRFATPTGTSNVKVWFKRAKIQWFYGRCYWGRRYISMHLPDPYIMKKVYVGSVGNGYLPWYAATFEEAVMALVAHEIFHVHQALNPRCHRVWGARGQQSERACDAYAIQKMREWRRTMPARRIAKLQGVALARYRVLGG